MIKMLFSTAALLTSWGAFAAVILLALLKKVRLSSAVYNVIMLPLLIFAYTLNVFIMNNSLMLLLPAILFSAAVMISTMTEKYDEAEAAEWAMKRLSLTAYFYSCLVCYYIAYYIWLWIQGGNFGYFFAVFAQLNAFAAVIDFKYFVIVIPLVIIWLICPMVYVFRAAKAIEGIEENGLLRKAGIVLKICAFIPVVNFFAAWAGIIFIKLRHRNKLYHPLMFTVMVIAGSLSTAFFWVNDVFDADGFASMLRSGTYTVSDFIEGENPGFYMDEGFVENKIFGSD